MMMMMMMMMIRIMMTTTMMIVMKIVILITIHPHTSTYNKQNLWARKSSERPRESYLG